MSERWPVEIYDQDDPEIWEAWGRFEQAHPEEVRRILRNFSREAIMQMHSEGIAEPVRPHIVEHMIQGALEVMADQILTAINNLPETPQAEAA